MNLSFYIKNDLVDAPVGICYRKTTFHFLAKENAEAEKKTREEEAETINGDTKEPTQHPKDDKPVEEPKSDEDLITVKGEPTYHELPTIDIDELVSDFNVDRKPANTILNPTIQAQSKSVGTAKDAHSNQSGKIATLPETGTADNLLLSVIGMGLSSLGLVISRREKHSK
ncbi:TPA: LPXTG cell wall anchor domain-containing protein [Streptococcus suis]|nr:LPXTG cell wall anchor domain-containing protein [Streptococcus suis]